LVVSRRVGSMQSAAPPPSGLLRRAQFFGSDTCMMAMLRLTSAIESTISSALRLMRGSRKGCRHAQRKK
jgi:hypothetical protein